VLYQTPRLGQRITAPSRIAADLEKQVTVLVEEMTPGLVAAEAGLGALTAAQLLLSCSHHGRIRSEAAFGMRPGTAPVPVSPGRNRRCREIRWFEMAELGRSAPGCGVLPGRAVIVLSAPFGRFLWLTS
jgi:hypothetical protein